MSRWSSKKERMVDALALEAEEGRDKLRKATGIGKHDMIRRYPNEATHHEEDMVYRKVGKTQRIEIS